MKRSSLIVASILVALIAAGAAYWTVFATAPAYKGPARHVIIISLDTTRADFLGCYGSDHVKTPNLDALAAEGVLFNDYVTAAPTTLSSHTSLFTGKYPHTHGVPRNGFVVNPDNVMLTETLKDAGFRTAGFIASFALDRRFNFAQGFDDWDQNFDHLIDQYGGDQDQRRADRVTDAVISYLNRGVPKHLFLFVHYFDPHLPYDPPSPYDTMYDKKGPLGVVDVADVRSKLAFRDPRGMEIARRMVYQYAGEISFMDAQIGRLLDFLRKKNILDNALLVVTSDHGESLWEQPLEIFDHGRVLSQGVLRSVGMMRFPGSEHAGRKINYTVSSIDVLPTVLNFLNLPLPPGVEGEPIIFDARPEQLQRFRFSEATKPHAETEVPGEWFNARKARCVRAGKYKFVFTPFTDTENLYDVVNDPREERDLLKSSNPSIDALATELRRRLTAWSASAAPLPTEYDTQHREDTLRRLATLGYVESDSSADARSPQVSTNPVASYDSSSTSKPARRKKPSAQDADRP